MGQTTLPNTGILHPHTPRVAAADETLLLPFPLTSANELTHKECGRSRDIIFWVTSATRCKCYVQWLVEIRIQMGRYIGVPTSHVPVFKFGVGICAVPTADAVATGKVSCIVQLRSITAF